MAAIGPEIAGGLDAEMLGVELGAKPLNENVSLLWQADDVIEPRF